MDSWHEAQARKSIKKRFSFDKFIGDPSKGVRSKERPKKRVFGVFRAGKTPKTPFFGLSLFPDPTKTRLLRRPAKG